MSKISLILGTIVGAPYLRPKIWCGELSLVQKTQETNCRITHTDNN